MTASGLRTVSMFIFAAGHDSKLLIDLLGGLVMSNMKNVWYRKAMAGKCLEIIPAVVLIALFMFSASTETFAAEENEVAYRMKPLQDKLAVLEDSDIDRELSLYADMDGHWSRREVGMLSCINIVSGYGGSFHPNDPVQVDQYIKMVVRSMGYTPGENTKYWAQNYIDIAVGQKLIAKNEFLDYKRPITREEAARIIVKATLLKEEFPYTDPYNTPDNLVRSKIKDYSAINDMDKQYVLQSYEIGLIQGSDGYFRPAGTLTRAEAATIMIRYLYKDSRVPFTPAPDEVFTCVNYDGSIVTAWPPPKKEVIDAANAFKNVGEKSKGFAVSGFSGTGHIIYFTFYESKDKFEENSILNKHMSVHIDTINDIELSKHPYYINVFNSREVKLLHRDVIYEMFLFWFDKDAEKAMGVFDKYLEYAITNDKENHIDEVSYNDRRLFFYRAIDDDGFSLTIHCKS